MNQDDGFDINYEYVSETQSTNKAEQENDQLNPEELYTYDIDSENYYSGKPRRVVIRAKIIHDKNN